MLGINWRSLMPGGVVAARALVLLSLASAAYYYFLPVLFDLQFRMTFMRRKAPEIATHPDIAARIAALSDGVPEQRPTCPEGAPGSLELPQYYNDGTMFQTGPSTHNVWGFAGNASCPVQVREKCRNGYVAFNSTSKFVWSESERLYIWEVEMPPVSENGLQCSLTISIGRLEKSLQIIFGDIWLCLGQSNMAMSMAQLKNSEAEVKEVSSGYSNLHLYRSGELVSNDVVHNRFVEPPDFHHPHWKKWQRANMSKPQLKDSSALCVLYGKYLTDQLRKEGRGTMQLGNDDLLHALVVVNILEE